MHALRILALLALCTASALVLALALAAWGRARWRARTQALETRLQAARTAPAQTRYNARELEGLPPPVQRYFRTVLRDGQAIVRSLRVQHSGQFNLGEEVDRWVPFTSRQHVVTQRPGFVWDARMPVLPGLPLLTVHVHDAYIGGRGELHPALLGLVPLGSPSPSAELDSGELMRFFAEAAWYPTALLPSQGVRWQAVDATSARATLTDGPLSITLTFSFGDDGLMTRVHAPARGRSIAGQNIPTPWEGRWFDYQRVEGMLVPTRGEVAWLLPVGDKPYWRGTVCALQVEFAP